MTDVFDKLNALGPAPTPKEKSSFGENWEMALGTTLETSLSISPLIANAGRDYKQERNDRISKLIQSGELPQKFRTSGLTPNEIAAIAKRDYNIPIDTDEDIDDRIREDIQTSMRMAQEVYSRAGFLGKLAQGGGTLHAYVLDPISIVGTLLGIGPTAKAATMLGRIGTAATYGAAATGVEEAAIQPFVYSWKNQVGIDYDVKDALTAIGTASLGGGMLAGGAKSIGEVVTAGKSLVNSHTISRLAKEDSAVQEAVTIMKNQIDELEQFKATDDAAEVLETVDGYIKATDETPPMYKTDDPVGEVTDEIPVPDDAVYVQEVRQTNAGPEVVTGNATTRIQELKIQKDALKKLRECLTV